jgi:pimeloyl-ACP methyl ester carboxylesterase
MDGERMVPMPDGAALCAETFGDPGDPAILLIGGLAASMDWWDERFCAALARGDGRGRYVIRYDHRDTGRSTTDPPGAPSYTSRSLTDDVVHLLDGLGIARAHLAGVSAGGAIAQEVALARPERAASVALMSTTFAVGGPDGLPGATPELRAVFESPPPDPDWADAGAVVEYLVEAERPFSGPGFDEDWAREPRPEAAAELRPDLREAHRGPRGVRPLIGAGRRHRPRRRRVRRVGSPPWPRTWTFPERSPPPVARCRSRRPRASGTSGGMCPSRPSPTGRRSRRPTARRSRRSWR